jgi:hypothetical protein
MICSSIKPRFRIRPAYSSRRPRIRQISRLSAAPPSCKGARRAGGEISSPHFSSPDVGSSTVYPAGQSSPSLTISDGLSNPYGIAVDSKDDIFASQLDSNNIVAYKSGATSPYETIDFAADGQALGVGVDGKDNIWIGSDSNSSVWEIPAGSSTPVNAGLTGLNGTINVAFGKKDEMFVCNFGHLNVIVYKYGMKSPTETITDGIEPNGPTPSGFTTSDYYFQSNQDDNVVCYKKGATSPFPPSRAFRILAASQAHLSLRDKRAARRYLHRLAAERFGVECVEKLLERGGSLSTHLLGRPRYEARRNVVHERAERLDCAREGFGLCTDEREHPGSADLAQEIE